jgi:hypothetical protein
VADDGAIVGIEADRLDTDDRCKTVCLVSCQRSPEPVFLTWKGLEAEGRGDFFVRSGPGTVRLSTDSAATYIRTRFPGVTPGGT